MLKEGIFGDRDPRPHHQQGSRNDLEFLKKYYNYTFCNLATFVPTKLATTNIFLAISGILKRNKSGMKVHKRYEITRRRVTNIFETYNEHKV